MTTYLMIPKRPEILACLFSIITAYFGNRNRGAIHNDRSFILDGSKYNIIEIGMSHQLPILIT